MLNRETLVRDPSSYRLADGGVAKVFFPPDAEQRAILREQLQTFVCKGAYADGLRRILEAFNGAAGKKVDTPAAWVSGFYGSGKSLLAAMLGALWADLKFEDGATAEGLVHDMPGELRAALRELRTKAKQYGGLIVGGSTLGLGSQHPVKAVLEVIFRAAGLPTGTDLRPSLVALWLAEQGILDQVRRDLGSEFEDALGEFLLDDRLAVAALKAKPGLAPDADTLMDRLGKQFEREPEPTVELMTEKARQALTLGRSDIPLTLIILDEVQQFIREDEDISLIIQTIAEQLASKFKGRVLLVCTGQSALGDMRYLARLLGRFPVPVALGSADIDSVIRETILLKQDAAKQGVAKMLEARSGEIDKHLASSTLKRTEADRAHAVADWPMLSTRRRLWERVLAELDKSGLGATLRGQLRLTLDAVRAYGERPLGVAVPADFLFDTFAAEALSRQLISRDIYDRIAALRAQAGDGPMKARILIVVYLLARISGDAHIHGVHATPEVIADLLVEDLGDAAPVRAKVPELLKSLFADGAVNEVGGEWRPQTKEGADWQQAYDRAYAREVADPNGAARQRTSLLEQAVDDALAGAGRVTQGASKHGRTIERVVGDAKPSGDGLTLRIWNGWDHALSGTLTEIRGADVQKDATLHLVVPDHRKDDLREALVAFRVATDVIQTQGPPATEGGKEAKKGMESRLERAEQTAKAILREAVANAHVLVAGGTEVGAGLSRADAVKEAAQRGLDRLYSEFVQADHVGWGRALDKARKKVPDALKEVGHAGEPQDHPVAKAILRHLGGGKKGSEIRAHFGGVPYGWPRDAVDATLVALANAGQIKVTGPDGKPVVLAEQNASTYGTCSFAAETRVVSAKEKIAVRALGGLVGLKIASGEEGNYLLSIVDRLAALAEEAGGPAPAPAAPDVPGMAEFRATTGNDLLAALAGQHDTLKPLISQWQAAKVEIVRRQRDWALAQRLVAVGATGQQAALDAILTGRTLLHEPNPLPPVITAATDDLRARAQAAYAAWKAAWDAGEARLAADEAWGKLSPEKRHNLRAQHALLLQPPPDLADPHRVADSLGARGLSEWQSMTLALPARVEAVLRDAAAEVEPKTQSVSLPRRTLRSPGDLDAWLAEVRGQIEPLLSAGPVRPVA
ncbi:BREX system P-loop protein BrxC [Roseomonas stagni]|uniref:BREX system P-loop protein BrxC n=1 Tax=Falsiroseomonas algicola TaxID=2716930 RepID=A0A6M1LWQ3_9PROT|nr:BREX system P-loop protein BrxC [Falsiroseomonas algicola]NGM24333.1 BREX system P-loop protein BrxC [Falsiroseomonas algicola]